MLTLKYLISYVSIKNITILVIGILFVVLYFDYYNEVKRRKNNYKITLALVESVERGSRGSCWAKCSYVIGEKKYTAKGTIRHQFCSTNIVGARFPVIYEKTNPNNQDLLFDASDYKFNGLMVPDSLR